MVTLACAPDRALLLVLLLYIPCLPVHLRTSPTRARVKTRIRSGYVVPTGTVFSEKTFSTFRKKNCAPQFTSKAIVIHKGRGNAGERITFNR